MPDLETPPSCLAEAEGLFAEYLAANNYPAQIRWITAEQILQSEDGNYLVYASGEESSRAEAGSRYAAGLEAGFGILLQALCATASQTVAEIYIPSGEADAKLNRIRSCLKFTCPLTVAPAAYVHDPAEWQRIKTAADERARRLREAFGF